MACGPTICRSVLSDEVHPNLTSGMGSNTVRIGCKEVLLDGRG